ncbi:MAG TPA: hypothetical protein VFX85_02935, partial [Solirubrobacterales bacterium]|nr:hypothetical protein [Solirubrobacterales bacterium]
LNIDFAGIQKLNYGQTAGAEEGKCSTLASSTGKFTGLASVTAETEFGTHHAALRAASVSGSPQFHLEGPPAMTARLRGSGASSGFDFQFGEVKCAGSIYTGTTEVSTYSEFTLAPVAYEGCTLGGAAATIDMNGCDYMLNITKVPFEGGLEILCEAGEEITITAGGKCTIHIPPQAAAGSVAYSNLGSGLTRELKIDFGGIQKLSYSQTAGAEEGKCSTLSTDTGKFTGTATVTAETDDLNAFHVGLWAASSEGSVNFHLEGPSRTTAKLTGAQEGATNVLDLQFGELKCTTAKFTATTEAATYTTFTASPTYEGCTLAGTAATVDVNGCKYLLHLSGASSGPLDVTCEAGKEITITAGTRCTVHIPPQTGLGSVAHTNLGSGLTKELTSDFTGVTGVSYSQTPGPGIGKCTAFSLTNGKFTNKATVTAETDDFNSFHAGLWVE